MKMRRERSYILVLPSMFTTGNLFCGFYSIVRTFNQDFEKASWAIILAGVFDLLDGRVARITRTQTQFGMEYDSIADVVSFGLAPALLAYVGFLEGYGQLGWAGSFFFAACGALRLARFNSTHDEMPKSYFVGLPIPAAAYLIAAAVIAYHSLHFFYPALVMLFLVFALGLLMVSVVRYRSFKDFDLRHRRSFFQLVLLVLLLALSAIRPEITLATLFGYYVFWAPVRELVGWIGSRVSKSPGGEMEQEDRNGL